MHPYKVEGLIFIEACSWRDVFEIWRANEAHRTGWQEYYQGRGFSSWEEWRQRFADAAGLPGRSWGLYEIADPLKTVPGFHGGPFKSWIERMYGDLRTPTFAQLANLDAVRSHAGIQAILEGFPAETTICGLLADDGVVIAEGMHRCCAVALAAAEHKPLRTRMRITLASALGEKLPSSIGGYEKK